MYMLYIAYYNDWYYRNAWYVINTSSVVCKGNSFKGVGGHLLNVWLLIRLLFPLFPRFSLLQEEVESAMPERKFFLLW